MLKYGAVPLEAYPKYVIPYTPIAIALMGGVLLIPVFQRLSLKWSFLCGAVVSTGIFFVAERLMETRIQSQALYFWECVSGLASHPFTGRAIVFPSLLSKALQNMD